MGLVRSKQLDLPELYDVLDPRYAKAGASVCKLNEVTITTNWELNGNYYMQTIGDMEDITASCKSVVQVKKLVEDTYEQTLEKDNLFANIVKIVSNDGSITVYSNKALTEAFDIQVLSFT